MENHEAFDWTEEERDAAAEFARLKETAENTSESASTREEAETARYKLLHSLKPRFGNARGTYMYCNLESNGRWTDWATTKRSAEMLEVWNSCTEKQRRRWGKLLNGLEVEIAVPGSWFTGVYKAIVCDSDEYIAKLEPLVDPDCLVHNCVTTCYCWPTQPGELRKILGQIGKIVLDGYSFEK